MFTRNEKKTAKINFNNNNVIFHDVQKDIDRRKSVVFNNREIRM